MGLCRSAKHELHVGRCGGGTGDVQGTSMGLLEILQGANHGTTHRLSQIMQDSSLPKPFLPWGKDCTAEMSCVPLSAWDPNPEHFWAQPEVSGSDSHCQPSMEFVLWLMLTRHIQIKSSPVGWVYLKGVKSVSRKDTVCLQGLLPVFRKQGAVLNQKQLWSCVTSAAKPQKQDQYPAFSNNLGYSVWNQHLLGMWHPVVTEHSQAQQIQYLWCEW